MNKSVQKNEALGSTGQMSQELKEEHERRRRHFRDHYKRQVIADVLSGKLSIDNIRDPEGAKISKYLVQRWKAEFRGQKFAVDALSQNRANFSQPIEIKPVSQEPMSNDVYQELITLRNENSRLKQIIAIDLGIKADISSTNLYASSAHSSYR